MFKFLKSKKGFTLVELMIVVVIMAILVAVAVPIYSAVTANAKKKTCIANMREIVSQINNYAMSQGKDVEGSITITSDGNKGSIADDDYDVTGISKATFVGLFQALPGCPSEGTYNVEIEAASAGSDAEGSVKVTIGCTGTNSTGHVYPAVAE